ncbi:hypothetical protein BCT90_00875 [Vibrio lentus]|uniref:restriction endonuclease subunit S n=1 Tax=Vibrio TaxID=662 RepID=UPI000C8363C6|nr:restriction endonuclease subunit S [Vibrio lentus]PMI12699.1 hypothetical protein BCU53_03690 [Vibrio lentus]PMK87333.1 hypothetical protein BCT90_00875 [Vibrio lentus]
MVPNGWEIGNFSSLGIKTIDGDRGKNYPKKDEYLEDGYCLFLGADNVSSNGLMLDKKTFLTREKHEQLGNGVVKYDDLLLIMRGNGTGRVCIYDRVISSYENARINSGLIIIRLNPDFLDKNFALQLMRSSFVIKQFESFMFGSAQPQLTVKILKSLKLPRPALPEQRKIAKTLSIWDKAISTTEKLIETCKQQKKALMQQLLTGKKRLRSSPKDGAETGKAFEGEWEEVNIASRFELITDYVASGSFASLKENVNVQDIESYAHYVRQTDLAAKFNNKKLKWVDKDSYDFLNKSNLFEGDILFTNIGDLGKVFYMPKLIKPATVAPNLVVLRTNQSNDSRFIYYMLASDVGQREIEKIKSGTGLPKINKTEFKTMKFRIPHLEEQQRIASVLTAADKEIEVLEVKLAHFKQEKKALMQQLLTGKRRVKVAETEAA